MEALQASALPLGDATIWIEGKIMLNCQICGQCKKGTIVPFIVKNKFFCSQNFNHLKLIFAHYLCLNG
jgi:hypothetical protein